MTNDILRFDAAVNPYGCSPAVVEALVTFARGRQYRFYGDEDGASLRARLGALHGLPPESFLVYNGCGEGLVWQLVATLLLEKGRLICPFPSYERFVDVARRCAHLAAHRIKVRTRPDLPGTIRVTSMTPDDNRTLLDVLARA